MPLQKNVHISGYDIIYFCILVPLQSLFESKLNFVYSSGIFHANYCTMTTFVKLLREIGFANEGEEIIGKIMKKFNLGVYFTLTARDTVKAYTLDVQKAFDKGKIEAGEGSVSHITISTLNRLIGPDVFLLEISDKVLGL